MKYSATHKTFITENGTVHFSFNIIETEGGISAYFKPAEDDFNAFKATGGKTIYFEYLQEAQTWVTVSPFEIDEELLIAFKEQLPVISKKTKAIKKSI